MTKTATVFGLCALAMIALGAVWYLKTQVFSFRAKPVLIVQAFPSVNFSPEANSVAYSIKGKDRYTWGRLSLPTEKTPDFWSSNGVAPHSGEKRELDNAMTSVKLLLRFNPELETSWIERSFAPTQIAQIDGVTFLRGHNEGNSKNAIVYIFTVN